MPVITTSLPVPEEQERPALSGRATVRAEQSGTSPIAIRTAGASDDARQVHAAADVAVLRSAAGA